MGEGVLLSVQDLSIAFKSEKKITRAVNRISFNVEEKKTLAIVGESGSGKSISSLSILKLLQKENVIFDSGEFVFSSSMVPEKENLSAHVSPYDDFLKTLRGKEIAMIFQEPMTSLNPVMTCGEQVVEVVRLHLGFSREKSRAHTISLFEKVKLPRASVLYDQFPHQLSGGQRQRVMIAMAISCNPKLLIADEPTTALDVTVQKEILILLKSLQEEQNMSLVFITHDLGVVAEIADNIVVMRRGEIVEQGIAKDVLANPSHPYTKGLLACRPEPGKKNHRLLTLANFVEGSVQTPNTTIAIGEIQTPKTVGELPILRVNNLSKHYVTSGGILGKHKSTVSAVKNVSFEIRRGETMGLVGESGCGKTTLSRMILGLIPPSEGEILFHINEENQSAKDINKISRESLRKLRKEIQIIFQDPYSSLNPKHTIGDSITEVMSSFKLHNNNASRKEKTIDLLEKVGLSAEHFNRYPHEFSGGQRQRVVIARALACEPSFIICDESVSALDVSVQAQVLNLLKDLQRDYNLTYLFISHDLNVVYYMSDRIIVMNKGMIEEAGSSHDVFHHPKTEYTKRLLSAIPGRNMV